VPLVSFLIPARDAARYVGDTIASLRGQRLAAWEAVVVDDHSSDGTAEAVARAAGGDPRVRLVTNEGRGVVAALNAAYRASSGAFLKFLDSDDVLAGSFSDHLAALTGSDACYHDLDVVGAGLEKIASLRLTGRFRDGAYVRFLEPGAVSPPRCAWIFSRGAAGAVFPLPADLASPHEDYWIAMALKRHARTIAHVDAPLYLYRQHASQLFGGLYSFAPRVVTFRARAMLRVLELMERQERAARGDPEVLRRLGAMRAYYGLLAVERLDAWDLARAPLPPAAKAKLLLLRKAPRLASALSRQKSRMSWGPLSAFK
jgi:glycosyltransferase involved in cell wall biosynthesis